MIDKNANTWFLTAVGCFVGGCTAAAAGGTWSTAGGFLASVFSTLVGVGYQKGVIKAPVEKRSLADIDLLASHKQSFLGLRKNSGLPISYWEELYDNLAHGNEFGMKYVDGTSFKVSRGNGKVKVSSPVPSSVTGRRGSERDATEFQAYINEEVECGYDYESNEEDIGNAVASALSSTSSSVFCSLLEQNDDQGQYA